MEYRSFIEENLMELERLKILMTSDLGAAFELFSISKRYNDVELLKESGKWCIDHLLNKKQLGLNNKKLERLGVLSDRIREARRIARLLINQGCETKWHIFRKFPDATYKEDHIPLLHNNTTLFLNWPSFGQFRSSLQLSHVSSNVMTGEVFRYLDLEGVYVPLSWDRTRDPRRLLNACMRLPEIHKTVRFNFGHQYCTETNPYYYIYRHYVIPTFDYIKENFLGSNADGDPIKYDIKTNDPVKCKREELPEIYRYYEEMIREFILTLYFEENLEEKCNVLGLPEISEDQWCSNVESWLRTISGKTGISIGR